MSETRFGIAMRPLAMSAKDQTDRQRRDRADHHRDDPEPAVGLDGARSEEVLGRLLAVVRPAEDRREDEREQARR